MILSYKPAESQGETSTLAVKAVVFDGEFHELADVVAERVVHSTGCEPSRAELRAVLDSSRRTRDENGVVTVSEFRLENAIDPDELILGLDDPVIIGVRLDDERVLVIFRGRVTHIGAALSESDESVTLTALDARRMFDTRELRGMTFASPAGGTASTDCRLVFNPDGVGNLDAVNSFAGNTSAPLFGDPSAPASEKDESFAGYWRLVDFCRYVLDHYLPAGEVRPLTGRDPLPLSDEQNPVLPPTDVDGMKPTRALDLVLATFGLDWWIDPFAVVKLSSPRDVSALPAFRILSSEAGAVKKVLLAAAGSEFSTHNTNVSSAGLSFSTLSSVNCWRVEGALEEHEARFELVKLWTDDEESTVTSDPNEGNRSHADYDLSLDAVFRQWGLNEDAFRDERDAYDFDDLFGAGTWVRRRRRFLPPYTLPKGEPRKTVVEVKGVGLGEDWRRVASGTIRLVEDRAAVYFDMEDVDGTNARLRLKDGALVALQDVTAVRVTAIVECDRRVSCEAAKGEQAGSKVEMKRTRRDESFRRVKRDASSAYASEGTGVVRDDAAGNGPMAKAAGIMRDEDEAVALSASFSVPWIEFGYRVGDLVSEVEGRDVTLRSKPGEEARYPMVQQVTYSFRRQETGFDLCVRRFGR